MNNTVPGRKYGSISRFLLLSMREHGRTVGKGYLNLIRVQDFRTGTKIDTTQDP